MASRDYQLLEVLYWYGAPFGRFIFSLIMQKTFSHTGRRSFAQKKNGVAMYHIRKNLSGEAIKSSPNIPQYGQNRDRKVRKYDRFARFLS
jgi:hypothetical protein